MRTKTINLQVTAKYDGCFCSDECKYNDSLSYRCCLDMRYEHLGRPALEIRDTLSDAFGRWQNYFGSDTRRKDELHKNYIHLHSRLHSIQEMLWMNKGTLGFRSVRTRECCRLFGMGEEQAAQPEHAQHCDICHAEVDKDGLWIDNYDTGTFVCKACQPKTCQHEILEPWMNE